MAIWEVKVRTFINNSSQNNLFPAVEFDIYDFTIEEGKVLKLYSLIKRTVETKIGEGVVFETISLERVDKDTGVDYLSSYGDSHKYDNYYQIPDFRYRLTAYQIQEIEKYKKAIYEKVGIVEDEDETSRVALRMMRPEMLFKLGKRHAYLLGNHTGIHPHSYAIDLLRAAENFYSSVTNADIEFLNINEQLVTFEEYEFIKTYIDNYDQSKEKPLNGVLNTSHEVTEEQKIVIDRILSQTKLDQDILMSVLIQIGKDENKDRILEVINNLDVKTIENLSKNIGVAELRSFLSQWEANRDNSDEKFWQKLFVNNSLVFSQLLAYPVTVLGGEVYLGGKSFNNKGGNIVDFLVQNTLSKNAAIVEIKTPQTSVLGPKYRGVYNVSKEVSGSLIQISNYRDSFLKEYNNLIKKGDELNSYEPDCVLIIGRLSELTTELELKSFELFRRSLKTVTILTFDELYSKLLSFYEFLKG